MLTDERIKQLMKAAFPRTNPSRAFIAFARLAESEARREALEEAADICDELGQSEQSVARDCADRIRALKDKPCAN